MPEIKPIVKGAIKLGEEIVEKRAAKKAAKKPIRRMAKTLYDLEKENKQSLRMRQLLESGERSSTERTLVGADFMGRKIKRVVKDGPKHHAIFLDDGTARRVTKPFVIDLVEEVGGYKHVSKKVEEGGPTLLDAAIKAYNKATTQFQTGALNTFTSRRQIKQSLQAYQQQVEQTGIKSLPHVAVEWISTGERKIMSEAYAKALEDANLVKIIAR